MDSFYGSFTARKKKHITWCHKNWELFETCNLYTPAHPPQLYPCTPSNDSGPIYTLQNILYTIPIYSLLSIVYHTDF